jgi:hypothetical protein
MKIERERTIDSSTTTHNHRHASGRVARDAGRSARCANHRRQIEPQDGYASARRRLMSPDGPIHRRAARGSVTLSVPCVRRSSHACVQGATSSHGMLACTCHGATSFSEFASWRRS